MGTIASGSGLTTTRAPFIEEAQARGELFIYQPYELYSEANHETWRRLFRRMLPRWERYATRAFQSGIDALRTAFASSSKATAKCVGLPSRMARSSMVVKP